MLTKERRREERREKTRRDEKRRQKESLILSDKLNPRARGINCQNLFGNVKKAFQNVQFEYTNYQCIDFMFSIYFAVNFSSSNCLLAKKKNSHTIH